MTNSDEAIRERIRNDLDRSYFVEACAGAGKTTLLVDRIVRALSTGRFQPSEIVALSFTRRSAADLKSKLRARVMAPETDAADALAKARARLDELFVGTIHSYCARILRQFPVEASLDPEFRELNDEAARQLFEQAFDRWFAAHTETPGHPVQAYLRRYSSKALPEARRILLDAAWRINEWRDHDAAWAEPPGDPSSLLEGALGEARVLADMLASGAAPGDALLESCGEFLPQLHAFLESPEPIRLDAVESAFPARLRATGRKKDFSDAFVRQAVLEQIERLRAALDRWQVHRGAALATALRHSLRELIDEYSGLKTAGGLVDYVDLMLRTQRLLEASPEIRHRLSTELRLMLVDEVQDVDPIQMDIVLALTAPGTSPDERTPEPGRIFLVGDSQQSIYRFRRANLSSLQRMRERLKEHVEFVELTHSYRSDAALQSFLNASFEAVPLVGDRAYVPMLEGPPRSIPLPPVVALPVPRPHGPYGPTRSAISDSYPDMVASFLRWLLSEEAPPCVRERDGRLRRVQPRDVAILVRRFVSYSGNVATLYAKACERAGVAVEVLGPSASAERDIAQTLVTALEAIEFPDDEVAVYGTLRGDLFAVPEQELFEALSAPHRLHPLQPVSRNEMGAHLKNALSVLAELHHTRSHRPPAATVRALLRATSFGVFADLRQPALSHGDEISAILMDARKASAEGLSFRAFVLRLRRRLEEPRGLEFRAPDGPQRVQLMTVHSAKGLEFPVVVLADPACGLTSAEPRQTVQAAERRAVFPIGPLQPHDLLRAAPAELEADMQEAQRLAYVAATRATSLLCVPGLGEGPSSLRVKHPAQRPWLSAFDGTLYPELADGASPRLAPALPFRGGRTVLSTPAQRPEWNEKSLLPGIHMTPSGQEVLWWDASEGPLAAPRPPTFEDESWLAEREPGASLGREGLALWRQRHAERLARGMTPSIVPLGPSQSEFPPEGSAAFPIEVLEIARHATGTSRGAPVRLGQIVHHILEISPTAAPPEQRARLVEQAVRLHAGTEEEAAFAEQAVTEWWHSAPCERLSRCRQVRTEVPIVFPSDDGFLVDGRIDCLAEWPDRISVIEFKTGQRRDISETQHRNQVAWYLKAVSDAYPGHAVDALIVYL